MEDNSIISAEFIEELDMAGRQIVDFDVIENAATQETLDNHVRRIAAENSSAYSKLSFSTAIMLIFLLLPLHFIKVLFVSEFL